MDIDGYEYDAVTDTKIVQAKRSMSAVNNSKNFLGKSTRNQIKRTIKLAEATGKTAEFWFKYGVHDEVRKYIEDKGGKIVTGLGQNEKLSYE